MFKMSFKLKEKLDGSLILVLPIWFRAFFLFIVVLLAAGIFVSGISISEQWVPILIILACMGGALYDEKWIFNKKENRIEYSSGTLLYSKKKIFKLNEVDTFIFTGNLREQSSNLSGHLIKSIVNFSLILKTGKVLNIDNSSDRVGRIELKIIADRVSEYCKIQLSVKNKK